MDNSEEALNEIKKRNPSNREVKISRTIPSFLDGELFVANLTTQDSKELIGENYYYKSQFNRDSRSFTSMDELALWISQVHNNSNRPVFLKRSPLGNFKMVSALIAILITITICVIVLVPFFGDVERAAAVPDILSNALTVILGFYFGSQVGNKQTTVHSSPE